LLAVFILIGNFKIIRMQNIKPDDLLIIDIETASCAPDYNKLDPMWQSLWDEKIHRIIPEGTTVSDFYHSRAGVMAEFSKIICISLAYFIKEHHYKMRVRSFYGDDETSILKRFLDIVTKIETINGRWCFAGHNIKEFDIPFICRRMVINQIPIPSFLDFQNMKPWETNIMDTFQYWRFGDYKNYTSLNLLAGALGVPSSKNDIDGSMVGDLYWHGSESERLQNMKRIVEYCQKDVITTGNIILRFKNIPIVPSTDIEIING